MVRLVLVQQPQPSSPADWPGSTSSFPFRRSAVRAGLYLRRSIHSSCLACFALSYTMPFFVRRFPNPVRLFSRYEVDTSATSKCVRKGHDRERAMFCRVSVGAGSNGSLKRSDCLPACPRELLCFIPCTVSTAFYSRKGTINP